jgi:hypothetical protein
MVFLSHGLYSGLAHEAEVVLIQVRDSSGHISSVSIHRAMEWILTRSPELRIRIVSLSVSGDPVSPLAGNAVDEAVSALVEAASVWWLLPETTDNAASYRQRPLRLP